jgi:hypothetical protein
MLRMQRPPQGRSAIALWERDPAPDVTPEALMDGRAPGVPGPGGRLRLGGDGAPPQPGDGGAGGNLLGAIPSWPHPAGAGRHLRQRLAALHDVGVLDRVWVRYRLKVPVTQLGAGPLARQDVVGEWAYALSAKGMT